MDDLQQNLSSLEAPYINPHNRLQNLSSVEEALRKERISLENEEPSMRISLGPEAAKLSALFIDAGEKTELECLALLEKRSFETTIAMSFWFLMASSTSMVDLDRKLEGFIVQFSFLYCVLL